MLAVYVLGFINDLIYLWPFCKMGRGRCALMLSSALTSRNPANKDPLKVFLWAPRMTVLQGMERGDTSGGMCPIPLPLMDSLSSASCSCAIGRCGVPCFIPTRSELPLCSWWHGPQVCLALHSWSHSSSSLSNWAQFGYYRKAVEASSGCKLFHSV